MQNKYVIMLLVGLLVVCLLCVMINAFPRNTSNVNPEALQEVYLYVRDTDVSASYTIYHLQCQGYSESEARAAVAAAKVDWQQEAIDCAKRVLGQHPEISFQDLNNWLEIEGFTQFERLKAIELVLEGD